MTETIEQAKERLRLKEQEIRLQEGLPHLYGWKWYTWAREFFESKRKLNFLCAANQISKSSTQIRKIIHWSTAPELWKELWPTRMSNEPIQFWYLYPTGKQATIEFDMKWKQFLPNHDFKSHPVYGWKEERNKDGVHAIHFNSGAHIYFKTYAQNVDSLQTGSVHSIFCDEELPIDLYDELIFRITATDGYFHMVFTATLGQEYWRQVMEPTYKETELLPMAAKWTVSMYDCMQYEDGSRTPWTLPKIKVVESRCKSHKEVLKRVHGKFIQDSGLKYPTFDYKRHMKPWHPLPLTWHVYAGVDIGSGGEKGHPAAIVFVAVRPDYRNAKVIHGWRGDGIPTTASDILDKYRELVKEANRPILNAWYDFASKDFEMIATRAGEAFLPAEKGHEKGEEIINTLFKNNMLSISETDELQKLAAELSSLRVEGDKRKKKDDMCDALRYALAKIPWDWSILGTLAEDYVEEVASEPKTALAQQIEDRRKAFEEEQLDEFQRIESEFSEVNELCES